MRKILYSVLLTSIFGITTNLNAKNNNFNSSKNHNSKTGEWKYRDGKHATGNAMNDLMRSGYVSYSKDDYAPSSDDGLDTNQIPNFDPPKKKKSKK